MDAPVTPLVQNPGLLGEEELIRSFAVRAADLELILETLRENAAAGSAPNQHMLFVGPRGAGKTMLVRRAAAEVGRNRELAAKWYPVLFGQETYRIGSPGEFWLEALFHVAEQTGEERWKRAHADLQKEADARRLADRALAQLLDFADRMGKRLLLVAENLNVLLGEHIGADGDWDLRHTLQNEARIMLLGTAVTRFEEIDNIDRAWFELLATYELKPLALEECAVLWRSVTGEEPDSGRVRAVQILTGGNPRLVALLAEFAARRSLRELMEKLVYLIDRNTEYFKSRLDGLPVQERRVFATLLERWDPVSAAEIGRLTRMDASKVSALLRRLEARGAVEVVEHERGRKLYQAAERLFNIYYQMRRRGSPAARVRMVVEFMARFYEAEELVNVVAQLTKEAPRLAPALRPEFYSVFEQLYTRAPGGAVQRKILEAVPAEFFKAPDLPPHLHREALEARHLARALHEAASDGQLDRVEALLGELRAVGERHADNAKIAIWHVTGLVSALIAFGKAGQLGGVETLMGQLRSVMEPHRHNAEIALVSVHGLFNALTLFLEAPKLDLVEVLLGELRSLEEAHPDNAVIILARAVGLFSSLHAFGKAGRLDRVEELLGELRSLRETHLDNAEIAVVLAHMLNGALYEFGKASRLDRIEVVLSELRSVAEEFPDELEIAVARARALFGAVGGFGKAGRLDRIEAALDELRSVAEAHPNDREIAVARTRGLGWALLSFGEAGRVDRIEALAEELGAVGEAHSDNAEVALECARGLVTALTSFGNSGQIDRIEAVAEQLGAVSQAHPDNAEIAVQRAEGLTNASHFLGVRRPERALEYAEKAAGIYRELVPQHPDHRPWFAATLEELAQALARLGRDEEASNARSEMLEQVARVLEGSELESSVLPLATGLLINAAAAGHAREALAVVSGSPHTAEFEPLVAGLRIYLGDKPRVAREIVEIGNDVAHRIRERKHRLRPRPSNPGETNGSVHPQRP